MRKKWMIKIKGLPSEMRSNKQANGQGLVELALVLPIFIIILLALTQFATIRYVEILLNIAVRHGGRVETLGGDGRKAISDYLSGYSVVNMDNLHVRVGRRWILTVYVTDIEVKYYITPMPALQRIFPENFHVRASYVM